MRGKQIMFVLEIITHWKPPLTQGLPEKGSTHVPGTMAIVKWTRMGTQFKARQSPN